MHQHYLPETAQANAASPELLNESGYAPVRIGRRTMTPQYYEKISRFLDVYAEVCEGLRPCMDLVTRFTHVRENLTTSDFPNLFGDVLSRELLGNYKAYQSSWPAYARRGQVPDFRQVKRFTIEGGQGILPEVKERSPYPAAYITEGANYGYRVTKRGERVPFSMEAIINDDLGALKDIPVRMGVSAARSEDMFIASLFMTSAGPSTSYFSTGNKNQIIQANGAANNNPALSTDALDDVYRVAGNMRDSDGQPILVEKFTLVIPPQLSVVAKKIMRATEVRVNPGATTGTQPTVPNFYRDDFDVVVNPYLPIINTTNGASAWYVFANPANGRPAMEVGFLRGYEAPQIMMKASNQMIVGGGLTDPTMGDFETDAVEYKVRHIFGGTLLDPKLSLVSLGTNS